MTLINDATMQKVEREQLPGMGGFSGGTIYAEFASAVAIEVLGQYTNFLLKQGYVDTDVFAEGETAIDQFIRHQNKKPL